jgi:O-succinylbenzoic acid--CoA ligase
MSDWLSIAAGLFNTKEYILTGDKTFSFTDINEKSTSLSHYLQNEYGMKRGDIAAVISENNIDFILLIFALWKTGSIPVPINIRLNDSEIDNLLIFLKPSFIYIDYGVKRNINFDSDKIIHVPPEDTVLSANTDISEFDKDDTALILFTSGTSGKPKGVELSFQNLKASFENSNTILNQDINDIWIATLPFYHIGGFSIIIRALLSGASLSIPPGLNTQYLADEIIRRKPTLLSLVSTQLKRLLELGIKPNAPLKGVLLGGGYIEELLLDKAIKDGWPAIKVYGSTETSSLVTYLDCNKEKNYKSSGGKPLANNRVFIVNDRKEPLPHNYKGEIAVKSDSCAKGYYNNPKETSEKFSEGIYYTGDTGFINEDGFLFIDSRRDDLIISGGENINPIEIETVLKGYPGIQNVTVFGLEDKEWGHIVSAAIITNPGSNISEYELKEFLMKEIASYKVPRKFYFVKEFPLSPLGKIQKEKLKEIVRKY